MPFLEDDIPSGEKDREGEGQGGGEKEWVVRLNRKKRENETGSIFKENFPEERKGVNLKKPNESQAE